MKRPIPFAMALATLAAILWALTLGASVLLPAGFPTLEVLAGRYGVQLLLLVALVMPLRGTSMIRTSRPKLHVLRGMMMLAMPLAFEIGAHRLGAADAWAILWLGPLFGIGLERSLSTESSPVALGLAAVATIGAMAAHSPATRPSVIGSIAVVGAAAAFGAFLVLTRALRGESAPTGLFWTAACVAIPSSLLLPAVWQPLTLRAVVALVAMGVLWLLVLLTIDEALRRAPLFLLAPFLLTEIVWARLLFRVQWTEAATVGAIVVLACAAWAVSRAWRSTDSPRPLSVSAIP